MTMILKLPEEVAQQLKAEAQAMEMSPEEWALTKLQRISTDTSSGNIADMEWQEISRRVIEENRELLLRLAK